MTPPKSPPQPAVSVEQQKAALFMRRFPYVKMQEGNRPVTVHWFDVVKAIDEAIALGLSAAPPADGVLREARSALDKYGQHRSGCNVARALPFERRSGNIQCTCGLDQVRAVFSAAPKVHTAPIREAGDLIRDDRRGFVEDEVFEPVRILLSDDFLYLNQGDGSDVSQITLMRASVPVLRSEMDRLAALSPSAGASVQETVEATFSEDINNQAIRIGVHASATESPAHWMMRVRKAALLAALDEQGEG